jgi:hypothetical protein
LPEPDIARKRPAIKYETVACNSFHEMRVRRVHSSGEN